MIFEKHRFEIWNMTQHPYKHSLDEFAYFNSALPNVTNLKSALDYIIAVFYPNAKGSVQDLAALNAITGQQINDYYVVIDDGDGKAASYRWEQREGDATPTWYKVYDMDWGEETILSNFLNKTLDVYVYKAGIDDLDELGDPLTGDDAGQHIYGGASANTNLILHANSGDGVGPNTGFIIFDDNVKPYLDNTYDIGDASFKFRSAFLGTSLIVADFIIQAGLITNTTGQISFDDENLITGGSIDASFALLGYGTETEPSLRFKDDPDTGIFGVESQVSAAVGGVEKLRLTSNQLLLGNGTQALPALSFLEDPDTGIYRSAEDSLAIAVNGQRRFQVNDDGSIGIGSYSKNNFVTIATPEVGYTRPAFTIFNFGSNDTMTVQTMDAGGFDAYFLRSDESPSTDGSTICLARSRGAYPARNRLDAGDIIGSLTAQGYSDGLGLSGLSGAISFSAEQNFDGTGVGSGIVLSTTPIGQFVPLPHFYLNSTGNLGLGVPVAQHKLHIEGDLRVDSILMDGSTISTITANANLILAPNGTGVIEIASKILPSTDNSTDLGDATKTIKDIYMKGSLRNNSLAIAIDTILSFRDALVGADDGHTLFYNTTTGKWTPSLPDSEIDHGTLLPSSLLDDDHTQYMLLAGRSGGQELIGGLDSGDNLTLSSTTDSTKGKVLTKDILAPFTDASYSAGWQGTDLGATSNYFRNVYTKGEFFGLRLQNVTTATLPTTSATNAGRLVFNTDNGKLYVDTGAQVKVAGVSKFVEDVAFDGVVTVKDVDVSSEIVDARNAIVQLKDNSNNFEVAHVTLKAISATIIRIETNVPLTAGTYRLIVME
jgi:hypothetical protein